MTRREKFFAVCNRQMEGYVPFEFSLCRAKQQEFFEKTGRKDYVEYYDIPLRYILPEYIGKQQYSRYYDKPEELKIDQWGTGHKPGSFHHFTKIISPLTKAESLDEIASFPLPDPVNDYDWEGFALEVKQLQQRDLILYGAMAATIFEVSWGIRGFEPFMMDLLEGDEKATCLMDRVLAIRLEFARLYAELGLDCLHLGDDVSTQLDMMMSVPLWQQTLKPRLAQIISTAKKTKPDMLMDYHGDGNLQRIIPDLIEIGVDILNPVQPECMDPFEIKRKYGDVLSFRGCLGTQTTLPFGTPQQVREECLRCIQEVGRGGGLILCPTHLIEPEVPWENFEAYLQVLREANSQ